MTDDFQICTMFLALLFAEMLLLDAAVRLFHALRHWNRRRRARRFEAIRDAASTRAAREREEMLRRDAAAARLYDAIKAR